MTFTLWEFDTDRHGDGAPAFNARGELMEFPEWEDAVVIARQLAANPASFPLVGINEDHNICGPDETCNRAVANPATGLLECPIHGRDVENEAWSAGWVQREPDGTTTVHEGDYDDAPIWATRTGGAA